ncbi:MAG TPA: TolC family protein [Rudaea sp.]|nr:TolC family protein [Rudaea sp.]
MPDLPSDLPAQWEHAPAGAAGPGAAEGWKAFADPALDRLVDAALAGNLTLRIAGDRLKAARFLHHRSRADFWPTLDFRVYEETAPGASTGYLEFGFDATWEFGLFGRSTGNARVSAADANTAIIDEAAARITVAAEVARTYVDLCTARAHVRLADAILAARQRQREVAQTRVDTHLGSRADLDHAASDLAAAQADAHDALVPVAESEAALAVLLGRRTTTEDIPTCDAPPALEGIALAPPPADLVRTRPEIRKAEQNVLRAAGELGIARADLFPKFGIIGTLISSTALTGDVDHPNKAVPLIGPTISLPILDWHARRAVVGAREAALDAAVLAYREAVLEGIEEVEASLARFAAKTALAADASAAAETASQSYERAAAARRIGLADDGELMGAKVALAQAELQKTQALRERGLAYIALYKAFGGAMPPLASAP